MLSLKVTLNGSGGGGATLTGLGGAAATAALVEGGAGHISLPL